MTHESLVSAWPSETRDLSLYREIYSDCVSALEHTPAHLFSGRVNWKAWKRSGLYDRLRLDVLMLDGLIQGGAPSEAEKCRAWLLENVGSVGRRQEVPWEELLTRYKSE